MGQFSLFVGIDVSKKWLDVAVFGKEQQLVSTRINNDTKSIKAYVLSIEFDKSDIFFVLKVQKGTGMIF